MYNYTQLTHENSFPTLPGRPCGVLLRNRSRPSRVPLVPPAALPPASSAPTSAPAAAAHCAAVWQPGARPVLRTRSAAADAAARLRTGLPAAAAGLPPATLVRTAAAGTLWSPQGGEETLPSGSIKAVQTANHRPRSLSANDRVHLSGRHPKDVRRW